MGRADEFYRFLFEHGVAADEAAGFDLHVVSCILALAASEADAEGVPLSDRTGLDAAGLTQLCALFFPDLALSTERPPAGLDQHEQTLRDILWMNSAEASLLELLLSRMIARRCQRPNHLWQDLGLASRGELSRLMQRHFPRLAERNSNDMKWKKYFYRMMCSSEGFRLCAAPVCNECDDFEDCFGGEDGESLLARMANGRDVSMEARP